MAEWQRAKKVDERTQCLIFGFVKKAQQLLEDNNSHLIITDLIFGLLYDFME